MATAPTTATEAPAKNKKGGIGKIFSLVIGGMITVGVIGIALLFLFSGSSGNNTPLTPIASLGALLKPIDVPSQGVTVKEFTDANCGKSADVKQLKFGERVTFTGKCAIIDANVTDGAMLFRYQNGKTHVMVPYATSPVLDSALVSITGASTIPADYKVTFGPYVGPTRAGVSNRTTDRGTWRQQ